MTTCCICLDDISSPCCCVPCGHVFCGTCIQNWSEFQGRSELAGYDIAQCPQCRTRIEYIQPVRLDVTDNILITGSNLERVWTHSEWHLALQQLLFQFTNSKIGKLYFDIRDSMSSMPLVQQLSKDVQKLKQTIVAGIEEISATEGMDNRMLLLWNHTQKGAMALNGKIMQLQRAAHIKNSWHGLTDVQKVFVAMAVVVCLTVIITDYSCSNGVFHSLVIPLFQTFLCIIYHIFYCVVYILFRPVLCILKCIGLVTKAVVDMVRTVLVGVGMVTMLILSIPWTLITSVIKLVVALFMLMFQIFVGLMKTLINIVPLFGLAYFLNTNVQQWTIQFLLKLQRNH